MKSPIHLIHKMPLTMVAAFFLAGIILHKMYFNWLLFSSLWMVLLISALLLIRTKKYSILIPKLTNIMFPLLIVSSGIISTALQQTSISEIPVRPQNYYGLVTEKIKSEATYTDYLVNLNCEFNEDSITNLNERIHFRGFDTTINQKLKPGSILLFNGAIKRIENRGNPGEFDYKRYMANKGIYYTTTCFKNYTATSNHKSNLKIAANNFRSYLISKFSEYEISEESTSLLSALTLGDKKLLSKETKNSFANSGAMHVLAVSGLHVGILFVLFRYLLNFLFPKSKFKIIKLIFLIIILWFYAFLTGLAPSVMRSCTMFTLIAIGENLKRKGNIYNSIGASALLLMLLNSKVIFEVGFQLSYLALFAIVFFQPRIANLIKVKNKPLNKIWKLTSVSLAAQIGTAPIAIYYFHQFPVYFWLSNLIVIPAAAIILYSTFTFFIFSAIPIIASKIAFLLDEFVALMMNLVEQISKLPHSTILNIYISDFTLISSYLIFFSFVLFVYFRHKKYIFYFLLSISLLLSSMLINNIQLLENRKLIVYNTFEPFILSIIDGKNHYYFTQKDSLSIYEKTLLQQTSGVNHSSSPRKLESNNKFHSINPQNNIIIKLDTLKLKIAQSFEKNIAFSNSFNIQIRYNDNHLYLNHINSQTINKALLSQKGFENYGTNLQAENKAFIIEF